MFMSAGGVGRGGGGIGGRRGAWGGGGAVFNTENYSICNVREMDLEKAIYILYNDMYMSTCNNIHIEISSVLPRYMFDNNNSIASDVN